MADYRFDVRSKEQFVADISACTKYERSLMGIYARWSESRTGRKTTFANLGVDNSGEFIHNVKNVIAEADFLLIQMDRPNRKIEIKFSRRFDKQFHVKENHLKYYSKNDVWLIVFNGTETKRPRFCILSPSTMDDALKNGYKCKFWNKPTIRFYSAQMEWYYP